MIFSVKLHKENDSKHFDAVPNLAVISIDFCTKNTIIICSQIWYKICLNQAICPDKSQTKAMTRFFRCICFSRSNSQKKVDRAVSRGKELKDCKKSAKYQRESKQSIKFLHSIIEKPGIYEKRPRGISIDSFQRSSRDEIPSEDFVSTDFLLLKA